MASLSGSGLFSLSERIEGWKNLKMSETEKRNSQEVLNRLKNASKQIERQTNDIVTLAWRIRTLKSLGGERLPLLATTLAIEASSNLNLYLIEMDKLQYRIVTGVNALEKLLATPALTVENN